MAQPAHLVVVRSENAPALKGLETGPFVPPPTSQITNTDRTRISRAALPRGARWIARALVLLLALAAPALAFAGEHKVTVDIEGKKTIVNTYARTPAALLARKGVHVAKDDLVTGDSKLGNDSHVVYRKAKHVRLVLDGKPQTVIAHGLTVGEALKDLGLVPGHKDHLYPTAATSLRPGTEIFVRNAVHAKLRVDGRLRDVVSSADTVGNLLKQAGVAVGPHDYVFPSISAEPKDGMWLRVVRVRREIVTRHVDIPFRSVTQRDSSMESGVRKVVQQGSEGSRLERFRVVLEDGKRVSSQLLESKVIRPARDYIVRVGTKEPTFKGGGGSQTGDASWFRADGLVAAHRSLPIGSVVKVTDVDTGKSVTVRINQRGPYVDGRIIDLSSDAFSRLAPLGTGTIHVRVDS